MNQDIKTEINPVLNPRAACPEGSLIGIPGILVHSISMYDCDDSFEISLEHKYALCFILFYLMLKPVIERLFACCN